MKHVLPGVVLLLAAACADTEIPPIEVGGPGGARLMNGQPRDAYEAYDFAHADMIKQHRDVRRNLDPRFKNTTGASQSMESIIRDLESMKSLVISEQQAMFDPYLTWYRKWYPDVSRDAVAGSFLSDLENNERQLKWKLSVNAVTLAAPAAAPAPAASPASKPPAAVPAGVPSDKALLPEAPPAAAPPAVPAAAPPPPAPAVSFRLSFKAWDRTHDDLVKGFKEKKDCHALYKDVVDALTLMKGQLPADRAGKLALYLDYYADVHEKTKGFKSVPEKSTLEETVTELEIAARLIRKEFNPDK